MVESTAVKAMAKPATVETAAVETAAMETAAMEPRTRGRRRGRKHADRCNCEQRDNCFPEHTLILLLNAPILLLNALPLKPQEAQ